MIILKKNCTRKTGRMAFSLSFQKTKGSGDVRKNALISPLLSQIMASLEGPF